MKNTVTKAQTFFSKFEKISMLYIITTLFFLTFIAYGNSLFNGFVWDDGEQIIYNSNIHNLSSISSLFTGGTYNSGGAGRLSGFYYRPFMPLSFSLNYAIWGDNPFGFHLFDVLLHLTNGILVFIFFKKIFSSQNYSFPNTIAFLLSTIFIVHPANVESVAYISSTQELLCTFFLLITMLLTLSFCQKNKFSTKTFILINLFILFSLLSKESGIIAIPLTLFIIFLLKRSKLTMFLLSIIATFAFYLILRFPIAKTPLGISHAVFPIANTPLISRLTTIPYEISSYLRILIFPKDLFVNQQLVIDQLTDPRFYVGLPISLLFLSLLSFIAIKSKSKIYLFFMLWIIFSGLVISNIYPLDMTIAERWLYLPMIGVLGIIGILISKILKSQKIKDYQILIIFLIIVSLLTIRTIIRNNDWKNDLTLFSHDLQYSKNDDLMLNNLAIIYMKNEEYRKAEEYLKKSLKLKPENAVTYNILGTLYQKTNRTAKAKNMFSISVENGGNDYLAYQNLALLKLETEDPTKMEPFIKNALAHFPNNDVLNMVAAVIYYEKGAKEQALQYAEKAYSISNSQDSYGLLQAIKEGKNIIYKNPNLSN